MTARRRLLAAVPAAAAVLGLSACEAPAPIVTVVSGAQSEWKEADVFCFEGQQLEQGTCVERAEGPVRIPVAPGGRLGIDVDRDVVERGWFYELSLGEQVQRSELQDEDHYTSLFVPNVGGETLRLVVKAVGEQGPEGPHSGEWVFDLVPEE